jgi:hypothetical protein
MALAASQETANLLKTMMMVQMLNNPMMQNNPMMAHAMQQWMGVTPPPPTFLAQGTMAPSTTTNTNLKYTLMKTQRREQINTFHNLFSFPKFFISEALGNMRERSL